MPVPFPATMPDILATTRGLACERSQHAQLVIDSAAHTPYEQPAFHPASLTIVKAYVFANIWGNSPGTYMMFVSYLISFITPYMVFPYTLNPFI